MYSIGINESGDKAIHSKPQHLFWNPMRFSSSMQASGWQCRQAFGGSYQAAAPLPVHVFRKYIATGGSNMKSSVVFGRQRFQPALLPLFQVNHSALNFHQNPKLSNNSSLYTQTQRSSTASFSVGAGDAPMVLDKFQSFAPANDPRFSKDEIPRSGDDKMIVNCCALKTEIQNENLAPVVKSEVSTSSLLECNREKLIRQTDGKASVIDSSTAEKPNTLQSSLDKFLLKIVESFNNLNFKNSISASQHKANINNLLMESRQYFYKLESSALCQILMENDDWEKTSCVADIFHHDFFSMADILSVYLLQLILAYNECGYLNIDPTGSDPLSILSFYRGEFRVGRVLPGVYQMHVTSYQYTTCTRLLVKEEQCPLRNVEVRKCTWNSNGDIQADILHWLTCKCCDPFHVSEKESRGFDVTDSEDEAVVSDESKCEFVEDATQLLKMLSWRVQFMQNPDLEEESYYLCCKAVKPYLNEPELIFQSDSFEFLFGKLVSPEMNFANPTLDEIELDCRPSACHFQVLHSFGHQLPLYSVAVGIFVDFLRHKRFKRAVF